MSAYEFDENAAVFWEKLRSLRLLPDRYKGGVLCTFVLPKSYLDKILSCRRQRR